MAGFDTIDQNGLRRISKEGAWVVFGQIAAVLGALFGVRLLSELLEPESYGELALAMTLAMFFHQTVFGPLGNGTTRFWSSAEEKDDLSAYLSVARKLLRSVSLWVIAAALITALVLLVLQQKIWATLAVLAGVFAILRGYNSIIGGMQNAARQRKIVALHQGAEVWARFLVAAALIGWLGASSSAAMGGFALGLLLVLSSQVFVFRRHLTIETTTTTPVRDWRNELWRFSWPFAAFGIFTWAQFASARWALETFAGTGDVGMYAILFQVGFFPMSILTAVVVQFLAPIFYQKVGDGQDESRKEHVSLLGARLTRFALAFTLVATVAAYLFSDALFYIVVAEDYRSVAYLLPWMVLPGGLIAVGQTIELRLMSMLASRSMIAAKVVTAVAGVIFNCVGAWQYGTVGVVIANTFFAVPYLIWMSYLAKHAMPDGS